MSDTERDDGCINDMPVSDPKIDQWKLPCDLDGEGAAMMNPAGPVDPGILGAAAGEMDGSDLDQLNDNIQDFLEDNLSLEVNFGDGSSCRASDNKPVDGSSPSSRSSMDRSPCLESMKQESEGEPMSDTGDTTPTASETVHSSSSSGNQSDTSVETTSNATHKRNSLEIRNNIPDVNETKSYGNDSVDNFNKLQTTGGVAKIRKKSPGLARRLAESMQIQNQERDTSSSEHESEPAQIDTTVHSAQKDFESHLKTGSAPVNTTTDSNCITQNEVQNVSDSKKKASSFEKLCDSLLGNGPNSSLPKNTDSDISPDDSEKAKSMEVENEYDYIKYARIQHGDSYVGMRLAYSTSQDPLNPRSDGMPPSDEEYLGSSREGSPEKMSQARQAKLKEALRMSKVSEDTLTEIPLNGSDHAANDDRNFSLSPEATECDSAEVESVLSDEGKSSTSGMPNVEDGLSSSQGSDGEDISTQDTPAEILKRRYKAEITQGLQAPDPESNGPLNAANENSSSIHSTPSHTSDGSRSKSDDIDMAIRDIKSAIERSKEAAKQRGEPTEGGSDGSQSQEPIWIMRDSYVRKIGNHDDLNQVREEYQRHHQGELQQQQEHVFQGGDDQEGDSPNKYPYGRHANKNFPSGKGFQSDDDIDARNREVFRQTRTVKGSHYRALPNDDPEEEKSLPPVASGDQCHHHSNNGYMGKQYGSHGDTNSGPSSVVGTLPTHNPSGTSPTGSSSTMQGPCQSHQGPSHKPFHSFSSAIPNSRYRSTAYSQYPSPYSQGVGDTHQSNHQSSPQQQSPPGGSQCDTASAVSPAMEQNTQQSRTKPVRTNPFNNLPKDSPEIDPRFVTSNTTPHIPKSVSHGAPEREPEPVRHRRRRYPSYEYHDDSEDEYYYESDGQQVAYIRERGEYDTDEETDELLDKQYTRSEKVDIPELTRPPVNNTPQVGEPEPEKRRSRAREVTLRDPSNETVLIEGVLFRARYLGSTQLISEGQPSKSLRMMQAQEAVGRIKAPEGENQPSTEVDLFVSIEKIMVLNTDLQEIMMDHALRTISYIADIGDILVIMARRGPVMSHLEEDDPNRKRQTKICCHVFESDEAQLIAQSIGQAFQVAYMEFLKANGIDDPSMFKEIDYQEVLNQQEIFGEELFLFSNKEMQKEVIVPKLKNEPLGVVIVESGWGSMVPTVVLANMSPAGAAARCGQLNIGDQIMSINGVSLVGLPLSSCQTYIKAAKNQSVVKLNVVSCAPVVEVCIKRPDVKYQLGFSVQNGVICSLLRGGIAERGGVRVGHRIIEINSESVVAVPHEKIVKMLATSVGEIHMKTMPTSIFRLLTGQDTPHYI